MTSPSIQRATDLVHSALDESAFYAARGERPHSKVHRGSPDQIWDILTGGPMARATRRYDGFDDFSMCHRAGVPERILVRAGAAMQGMVERGVRVNQLTTAAGVEVDLPDHPSLMWHAGGRARVVDELLFKICLFDRRVAVVPLDLAVLVNGLLIISDPVVVALLARLHALLWRAGRAVEQLTGGLPEHLAPVLERLASGQTDHRAATSLGMSSRTYSRRVAELLDTMGVASRFEAGIEAHRRGWLPR
ncbi:helix-turn-helix transcriptional regulator [Pseudonocardia sp. DLS-67]